MILSPAMISTIRIEVIRMPLAKFVFLLRMPRKNKGRLISAPILMSPPNFFCLYKEAIESSIGPSEK